MGRSAAGLARELLDVGPGGLEELRVHDFIDDEAAHDDEQIERLRSDFAENFERIRQELSGHYGEPSRTGEADQGFLPLGGVFRFAAWDVGGQTLFVAAAQEDRGVPILLVIGTAASESA